MAPQSEQTYVCTCAIFPDGHKVRKSARTSHNVEIRTHQEDIEKSATLAGGAIVNSNDGGTTTTPESDLPAILAALTLADSNTISPSMPRAGEIPFEALQSSVKKLVENRFQTPRRQASVAIHNADKSSVNLKAHEKKCIRILDAVELEIHEAGRKLDFSGHPFPNHETLRNLVNDAAKCVHSAGSSISKGIGNASDEYVLQRKNEVLRLLRNVNSRITQLKALLPKDSERSDIPVLIDIGRILNNPIEKLDTIAQVTILLAAVAHFIMGLSGQSADFIINVVAMIIQMAMSTGMPKETTHLSTSQTFILQQIPTTLYTALGQFHLDGESTTYAACPSCNFTHKPVYNPITSTTTYAERCKNIIVGKEGPLVCGSDLLVMRNGSKEPLKPFVTMSLQDYLARTLSDPQALRLCKQACDNAITNLRAGSSKSSNSSRNIFDSSFIQSFEGPVPGKLFIDRGDNIRLAFAIHVDFFNPNNSRRASHNSIGIISLANLNLPEDMRYTPEFIFPVGIIPGPHEPPLEELNHYIRPIIDELVIGWSPGYRLSSTPDNDNGEQVQIAVIISVNDLPAARKVSGMAGTSANIYCTVCQCRDRKTMYRTDFEAWSNRNPFEMRKHAEDWRDARTLKERAIIEKLHGIRWSELWRLPYWNPVKMLVVDSMHCILEGLVHYHCRYVLRLDAVEAKSEPRNSAFCYPWTLYENNKNPKYQGFDNKAFKQVQSIQNLLERPLFCELDPLDDEQLRRRLLTMNKDPLMYVADDLDLLAQKVVGNTGVLVDPTTKEQIVTLLVKWRLDLPLSPQKPPPKTCDLNTLKYIQNVIKRTDTPSWIHSVPHNYGEAAAGIIKAGEWRLLSTIFIPIALVTLWGDVTDSSDNAHFLQVLDHSMALFEAITLVLRNTATPSRALQYQQLLKKWVDGLYTIHPHTIGHPKRINVHVAFHVYDFLVLFGPVMSWWAFPFERLIGVLQRINTNDIVGGPLECTILRSYTRGANLRRWLRRPDCPEVLHQFKNLFDKAYPSGNNHSHKNDHDSSSRMPKEVAHYNHGGVNYSRASTHIGNSLILYYPDLGAVKPIVGSIQKITTSDLGVRLHVQRQVPLQPGQHDPFKRYPSFPAMTYSANIETKRPPDLISFDSVLTHVARFTFGDRAVIVNLSRI